ncbi:MAG: type III secretion system chaperone [Verrucomicrobia bacterium]|nr:type III secretion system chaperone [Verrucomicrobiota bacterium]
MPDALQGAALFAADLVTELGGELPGNDGHAWVGLNNGTALEITVLGATTIYLSSPLVLPGEPLPASLWYQLLESNYFWKDARGAVFAVDAGLPVLVRSIDLTNLSYDQFRVTVEQFLNTVAAWVGACHKLTHEPGDGPRLSDPTASWML